MIEITDIVKVKCVIKRHQRPLIGTAGVVEGTSGEQCWVRFDDGPAEWFDRDFLEIVEKGEEK